LRSRKQNKTDGCDAIDGQHVSGQFTGDMSLMTSLFTLSCNYCRCLYLLTARRERRTCRYISCQLCTLHNPDCGRLYDHWVALTNQ